VRPTAEFGALLLVTGETGFVDAAAGEQPRRGELRHRVVTVAAADAADIVDRARPEDARAALVALQALAILCFQGRAALAGKRDDRLRVGGVLDVLRAGPVAGFAAALGQLVAGIEAKDLRVDGVRPVLLLELVALRAAGLAEVAIFILRKRRRDR
jgi:hypothetical protein